MYKYDQNIAVRPVDTVTTIWVMKLQIILYKFVTDYFIVSSILQMHHKFYAKNKSMTGNFYHKGFMHSSSVTPRMYVYIACCYILSGCSNFLTHHFLGNQII
jgi:hypothetical protein